MITAGAPTLSQAPYWYVTRSTGIAAFVLLTLATVVGVTATHRGAASPRWPRFVTQDLHRNLSLLALGLLVVHIVSTIVDGFVSISWWSVIVPGASDYRTWWVALGTIAFDTLLLILATSLLRLQLSPSWWRGIHLSSYLMWPLLWLHFWKTGTDAAHGRFGLWIDIAAAALVCLAAVVRLATRNQQPTPLRSLSATPS